MDYIVLAWRCTGLQWGCKGALFNNMHTLQICLYQTGCPGFTVAEPSAYNRAARPWSVSGVIRFFFWHKLPFLFWYKLSVDN